MKPVPAVLLAAVVAIGVAYAADGDNNYAVWGLGQASCNSYNQARAGEDIAKFKTFIAGYFTAYNAYVPETYNITATTDIETVLSWLDNYCQEKQVDSFEGALHHFVEQARDRRQQQSPGKASSWP